MVRASFIYSGYKWINTLKWETQRRQYEGHNTPLGSIILTKAHKAMVSIMANGSIVA